ncbi:AAA-like domain-containing protein [Sphingomonas sp. PB1R3]|uniref:AAA-like domain-containing protein n=1 Tax=Sphingomonas flavida TaxID=3096154 RepID=UPI002FCB4D1B
MHTAKVLRGTTIVPDGLYVERAADRQLRAIVEDMGRPGYVLVARQMGKTNMLLRMKRQQEGAGSIAIFIDLSTGFPSASELFRKIVDDLLEVIDDRDLTHAIQKERDSQDHSAGIEYDRHLRLCLSKVQGRFVIIILDEIDSLVGLDFSDRILAQIRSMYFARANHTIYNNLTYVLSGVAEPTDLIKDKNISPFNIGEKIYLDDFTRAEQGLLLRKAGLSFGQDVEEAIFDWARGNPRMTWDICSSLEDMQRAQVVVSALDVEEVVKRLYFERFDRPPIDHIRDLAENDHSLRNALVALLYGKGSTLSDRDKSRLYLSGITTASANKAPTIKNRVIEEALSADWLAQVEEGKAGLLTAANSQAKDKRFIEALRLYDRYMAEGGREDDLAELDLYQYGIVLHNLGRPEDAARVLNLAISKTRSPEARLAMRYHLGLSYLVASDYDDAERELDLVANGTNSLYALRALHALSTVKLSRDDETSALEAVELANRVIRRIESEQDLTEGEKKEIRSASLFNLGQALLSSNRDSALAFLREAYEASVEDERPFYAAGLLSQGEYSNVEERVLSEVALQLASGDLPYGESQTEVGFKKRHLGVILGAAELIGDQIAIGNILQAICKRSSDKPFEAVFDVVNSVARQGGQLRVSQAGFRMLTERDELRADVAPHRLMEAARLRDAIADLSGGSQDGEGAFENFFITVRSSIGSDAVLAADLLRLSNRIQQEITRGRLGPAKVIIEFIRSHRDDFEKLDKSVLALCIYHEMIVHRMSAEVPDAIVAAQEVVSLLARRSDLDASSYMTRQVQDQLKANALKVLALQKRKPTSTKPNEEIVVINTRTGLRTAMKYKKAAAGLKDGTLRRI